MSSTSALPRPSQVTLLTVMICGGSVLSVLFTFDAVSRLGSIETQESLARTIGRPPIEGLGLTVDEAQRIVRVLCFVTAAVAAASAVLGRQLLQRSRQARLALSVLAPVLFLASSFSTGPGFAEAVVAGAVVMLWTQPSRDWFAGRTPAPRPAVTAAAPAGGALPPSAPWPPTAPDPRTSAALGAPAAGSGAVPAEVGARPQALVTAVVLTFLGVGTALVMLVAGVVAIAQERATLLAEIEDRLPTEQERAGASPEFLLGMVVAMLLALALWAIAVIPVALAVLRGREWARLTLLVSAYVAAVASLLGVLAVAPILVTGLCVASGMLLGRREVTGWCRAVSAQRRHAAPGPQAPQGPQGPPPSHPSPPSS